MAIGTISNGESGSSVRSKLNEAINSVNTTMENRVVVKTASQLSGVLSSTTQYFLDGIIDMGSTEIEIPTGGLYIAGYNFDLSGLTSTAAGFTLFTSPVGGSGNVLFDNFLIDVSGAGSQVYDLVADTGFEAIELDRINYNNCSSLGVVDNYRQGLEGGTGRFGGTPNLTLKGIWLGGFRVTTSIVRSLSASMTGSLFQAGVGFRMDSRFLSDINCDLPASAALFDFDATHFPNSSTLQMIGAIISRDGVISANDANLTPNIEAASIAAAWSANNGLDNTFVGAFADLTTEVTTVVSTQNVAVPLLGTYTKSDFQHFDSPANGEIRYLGSSPTEFNVIYDFLLEGVANDAYRIELVRTDGITPVVIHTKIRTVNQLQGPRDTAYYAGNIGIILDVNESLFWQVVNTSGTGDCTLEVDSTWRVTAR